MSRRRLWRRAAAPERERRERLIWGRLSVRIALREPHASISMAEVFWRVEIANKMLRDNYVDLMVSVNKSDSKIEFFLNKRYQTNFTWRNDQHKYNGLRIEKGVRRNERGALHCAHQVTYTSRFQKCEERVPIGQHRH